MSEQAPSGSVKAGGSYVEFFAVDGKFNKDVTKLQNRLKAFGSFATKAGAMLSAAGAGAAGSFLATAKSFADAGSAIDDMSQRTGVAVKWLSEMRYATQMSGTSMEAFETGIKGMTKAQFGADEESKTALKTLSSLGLSIGALKGMSPEQAFLTIAESLSQVEDPTRRAALSMKVFGKAGSDLLPLMNGGRKGIEDLQAAAAKLGVSMSADDVAAAAALGDSLDELQMAIGGVKNAIGAAVAGPLKEWLDWFRDEIPAATKWVKENEGAVVTVGKLSAGLAIGGSALSAFGIAMTGISMGLGKVSSVAVGTIKHIRAIGAAGLVAVAYALGQAFLKWAGNQEELNRQLEITNRLNKELADHEAKKTQSAIEENRGKKSLGDRRKDIDDKVAMAEKNLKGSADGLAAAQQNLTDNSGWWNGTIDTVWGSAEMDGFRQDIKDAQQRVDAQREQLKLLKEEQDAIKAEQYKEHEDKLRKPMADAINSGIAGATRWGQTMIPRAAGLVEAGKEYAKKKTDEAEDRRKSLEDDAKALKEDQKTPEEKARDRIARAQRMRDAGLIDDRELSMEKAKVQLEVTQDKADKLAERTNKRESLNVGVSEEQKNFLAMQAGKRDVQAEQLKAVKDGAKTQAEILAETRRLNQYLAANGVALVEVGDA